MAEPADINVDELRRRARRRLIGAVVLALGAAVIVPTPQAVPVPLPVPETTKSASKPPASMDTNAATPAQIREGFAVQLAAYADDKGANALANRLKRSGYPAYTEPLKTSRGTLWRVRVGPYSSRDAATGVRDKLKAEGQSGIVASAR